MSSFAAGGVPTSYPLGPGDQLAIQVVDAEEFNGKGFRVGEQGDLDLPLVGTLHAGGMTVTEFRRSLETALRKFIKQPMVSVSLAEMRSQPISVLGAVNSPGVHQLQGQKTLVEILAMAGGLRSEAGYRIKITRDLTWGTVPLPGATTDETGRYSVAEVDAKSLLEARSPAENIRVQPHDVVTVPAAEMIYVIGNVKKAGAFVMGNREKISVLQALAMAEGMDSMARSTDARILRAQGNDGSRIEVPVDLKKIMEGKAADVPMQSRDVLFVPNSSVKRIGLRALESMISIGSGLAVYTR